VGLANIALKNAIQVGNDQTKSDYQDKMLHRAYNKYLDILTHDHTNAYAAVGMANVLAFFNKTDDAMEIYK
jgi:hypothetical protein